MDIKTFPYKPLAEKWETFGKLYQKGFKPDYVSQYYVQYFSDKRIQFYKSLQQNPNKGLLVMGGKGIGKTINFFVYRKIKHRFSFQPFKIVSAKEIETQVRIQGESFLSELIECPELVIDDIGTESQTFKDYGTDRNLIHDILMQRYVRFQRGECVTHGTTNLNLELLTKFYDARLIDRMKEMFILQIIKGESKR